jgi:putative transposase
MSDTYQSGVRFRANPDKGLATTLAQWIGCQRVIYNGKTEEDRYFSRFYNKSLGLTGEERPVDQQYSQFKDRELTPWLFEVPSQILRNGAVRFIHAKQRQLKGLSRAPVRKRAHGRQTVLITSELFRFEPDGKGGHRLQLGTERNPVGYLPFTAHRPYRVPNQIVVTREAGRWYVSFSYEKASEEILRSPEELAYELSLLSDEELQGMTLGHDRGVVNALATSTGSMYRPPAICEERKAKKDRYIRRLQRKLARQEKGSKRRARTRQKIAKAARYAANCREDFAHKVSRELVDQPFRFFVFEALKIQNMTRRPKARQENGKWARNGARAKAGLHRSILDSAWGPVGRYVRYKAANVNKLCIEVPPHYSSQECSRCGHIHPDNRLSQAEFVCKRCGHAEHADTNAARVLVKRGIGAIRKGIAQKPKKKVAFRRKRTPQGRDGLEALG